LVEKRRREKKRERRDRRDLRDKFFDMRLGEKKKE